MEETFAWSNCLVGADTAGDEVGHQNQEIPWWDEPPISGAFVSDWAGNTFATARPITLGVTPTTFTDWVGSTDTLDFYRFSLNQPSMVHFTLNGLTADADLWLFDDQGNVIQGSWNWGTIPESISQSLGAGTYFLLVNQYSGSTFYNLTATATNPDLAGNTLNTARNITLGAIPTTFTDWVGSTDTNDYYRFTLPTTSTITLSLTGLSADADLELLSSTGVVLQSSRNWGTQDEHITSPLSAGTYFIRVYPYGSTNTHYQLTVAATELIPPPSTTGFNATYGYGLVNAAAAVARAIGQTSPFPDVPNLGGNNWGNDLVNAPEVWARGYTGNGIVVAVVDTGVDYHHPDLNDNIWRNPGEIAGNGIDDDGNGYVDDVHGWDFINNDNDPLDRNGHGTHVAGTIAAENNGFGVTGVAYNARIMPVQVLGDNGSGSSRAVANGIRYAANNGAHVINLSLGSNLPSPEIYSAIQYATSRGAVVVMAAGNDGDPQPDYPAFFATEFGLSVGAVDMNRNIAGLSNRAGTDSALYHVVAPGVGIVSTVPNNRYISYNGTSMATPHVAGVVALMLSANPNLTPAQVRDIIVGSATRLA
ncbi:S8 family serine peptidase [Gloeomargarita sp.]